MNQFAPTGQGQPQSFMPEGSNSGQPVEVAAAPAVELTPHEKLSAISAWIKARDARRFIEAEEMSARNQMVAILFPTAKKGTQRYVDPLGNGAIKFVHGLTYTLGDKEKLDEAGVKVPIADQVAAMLATIEKEFGIEGEQLTQRLVKWKPELSPTEYLALDVTFAVQARAKELIDAMLTIKPASPQIEVEPPKQPK